MNRLAKRRRVYCLYDMIGQSEMLSFHGTGNITCVGHRGLSGTKRKRSVRAGVPNVLLLVFCQTSWQDPRGLIANVSYFYVFLKASSGERGLGRFDDWTWGCGDCYNLHGLESLRVAREEKYQVPCSLWGDVSCRGTASQLAPTVRLFVFICLRLRLSPSSPTSVFVCLCLRLPPSSPVSVVVPGGWSRGRRLSARCSTSRVWKLPWCACSKFVRYSVEHGT